MGTTEQRLFLKSPRPESPPLPPTLTLINTLGEWVFARTVEHLPISDFEAIVLGTDGFPAKLGSHVEDSDYAYLVAAASGGMVCRLLFNGGSARDYADGLWAIRSCGRQYGRIDWFKDAAGCLAGWSQLAPKAVGASTIRRLLEQKWTFADDALRELGGKLNLPTDLLPPGFDGALGLMHQGVFSFGSVRINSKTARYVVGWGDGFVGIWDRQTPGPPVRRFASTAEGLLEAHNELLDLMGKGST